MKYFLHLFLSIFLITTSFALGQECYNSDQGKIISSTNFGNITSTTPTNLSYVTNGYSSNEINDLIDNNINSSMEINTSIGSSISSKGNINTTFTISTTNPIPANNKIYLYLKSRISVINQIGESKITLRVYNSNNTDQSKTEQFTINTNSSSNVENIIGTVANFDVNRIEITLEGSVNSGQILYELSHLKTAPPCNFETLTTCNESVDINTTNFPNGLSSSNNDFITGSSVSFALSGTLEITNNNVFGSNQFISFEITEGGLAGLGSSYTIETYLGDFLQDSKTLSGAGISLVTGGNKSIGLVSSKPFNKIILKGSIAGLSGFTVQKASILKSCSDIPNYNCNDFTALTNPQQPMYVVTERTGLSGVAQVATTFTNPNAILDATETTYAQISIPVGAGVQGRISVRNLNEVYTAGHYAGFNIENTNLLNLNLLNNFIITTYKNGVVQESVTGNNLLLNLSLIGGSNRANVGFITTKDFDEIQFSTASTLSINLGNIKIYNAVVKKFCGIDPADWDSTFTCNTNTIINNPTHSVYIDNQNTKSTSLGLAGITIGPLATISDVDKIIDNDTNNYATISGVGVGTKATIAIKNAIDTYPASTTNPYFVGFEISSSSLANISVGNNAKIITYKDGIEQEVSDSTNTSLIGASLIDNQSAGIIGFNATVPFDEIRYEVSSLIDLEVGVTRIHNLVIKKFCGIDPADWETIFSCNTYANINTPTHSVFIDGQNTNSKSLGIVDLAIGPLATISDVDNIIDNDTNNYASISRLGLGTQTTIAIKNAIDIYPASVATPYFVGFEISTANGAEIELANNVKIVTFLNGVEQESSNIGNTTLLGATVVETWKKGTIGFVATMPFDEIRYQASSLLNAELGETRIHNLVIKRFCENIDLSCTDPNTANKYITVNNSNFPLRAYASIDGLAQVDLISGSQVQNISNLIDDDQSTFVRISPTISIPTIITIGVEKLISNFPENTYAEFEIKKSSLVNLNLLSNYSVKLYDINNNEVQTISSNNLLVGLGLFQLGGNETQKIGFKSDVPFNRAELIINKLADVDLGVLDIYGFNVMKTCPTTIDCNFNEPITTANRPVIINSLRTGVFGVACVGCNVTNPGNVIDEDLTNISNLSFTAGIGANTSLSIKDLANVYPKGTSVGFTLTDMNPLLNLDLISGIRVKTFLNNVEQEEFGGESLLNINLLFIKINPDDYVIGFKTSKRFDEVQISVGSVASLLNVISVSNLVINTSTANDTDPGSNLVCEEGCTKPGDFTTNGQPTNVGITTLQSKRPDWPYDIPNGFIALESKNKGFVLNRTTSDITKITQPVEGMIIYDTTAQCVKLFNGQEWKCITKSCND